MTDAAERRAARAVLILCMAALPAVAIPYLQLPFAGEHGLYAFGGWRLLLGEVPYRDFWNMNTPAVLVVHAIGDVLFGHNMRSIRLMDVLWMVATGFFLYRAALRAFGPLAASLTLLLAVATYFTLGIQPTAQRDGWCLLPVLVILDAVQRPSLGPWRTGLIVGVAGAAAFWLKPPFLLPSAAAAATLLRRRAAAIPIAAVALAAFAGVTGAVLLYFSLHGALGDFYDNVVLFDREYVGDRYSLGEQLAIFRELALADPTIAVGFLGWLVAIRRDDARPFVAVAAACLAVAVVQGKLYGYHLTALRILLCAGTASLAVTLWRAPRWKAATRAAAFAILLTAAWMSSLAFRAWQYPEIWRALSQGRDASVSREESRLADFLAKHTRPNDTLFIWGVGPPGTVLYLAQRRGATRFTLSYPFSLAHDDSPLVARWRRELMEALRKDPPRVVVLTSGDAWEGLKNVDSGVSFERFTALRDFVAVNYRLAAEAQGGIAYRIFLRAEPGPTAAAPPAP
jgi:hypothetical protein